MKREPPKPPTARQNTESRKERPDMDFIFCQEKEQRVSKAVCEANVKKGKCTQDLLKCQKAKTPKATAPRLPDIDILADNPNLNKVRNSITDQTTEREGQLNLFPERKE